MGREQRAGKHHQAQWAQSSLRQAASGEVGRVNAGTSWREGGEAGDMFSKPLRPGRGQFQTRCPGRQLWFHVYEPALNKQKHQELKTKSHHTLVIV